MKRAPFRTRKWEPKPATQSTYTPRPRAAPEVKDAPSVLRCMPKDPKPVRDEGYRRLVASLPCAACGVHASSQCAHANASKAKSRKNCDLLTFPLCHEGANGCHRKWDTYAWGRAYQAEREVIYIANTKSTLSWIAESDLKVRRVLERVGILQPAT